MGLPLSLVGKSAVVATMHGKEQVIRPSLSLLGLSFLPAPSIDTDRFGTFTREIQRTGNQKDALLAKAQAGLELSPKADFAIASEGAFGPHPTLPFLSSGFEMVGLLERQSGNLVIGYHLTTETNFAQALAKTWSDAENFAAQIGFPQHAIVVMETQNGPVLAKGLCNKEDFQPLCEAAIKRIGSVWLETDMRAHLNPTRMTAIGKAAGDLLHRLQARCPNCGYPDWVPQVNGGRPCALCKAPTNEAWIEKYLCTACGHREERLIDPERKVEPRHCNFCNP